VIVFSGGGEPAGQYRDFSATATLLEDGRREVALVLDRYAGTSHELHLGPAGARPAARATVTEGAHPPAAPPPDLTPDVASAPSESAPS
jgi:hypothetical protein